MHILEENMLNNIQEECEDIKGTTRICKSTDREHTTPCLITISHPLDKVVR
jgi:hypothetical protein